MNAQAQDYPGTKDKIKIKKCYNPYTKEWELIAFILNAPATPGCVLSYQHIGQHSEASREFMYQCRKASPEESVPLVNELRSIGYEL